MLVAEVKKWSAYNSYRIAQIIVEARWSEEREWQLLILQGGTDITPGAKNYTVNCRLGPLEYHRWSLTPKEIPFWNIRLHVRTGKSLPVSFNHFREVRHE